MELWTYATAEHRGLAPALAAFLPRHELKRIERLRVEEQRTEALVSAVFLRAVLARGVGGAGLPELRIDSTCARCGHPTHGKPRLVVPAGGSVCFSLSHARGLAVLAVSSVEVGVDVEPVVAQDAVATSAVALSDRERSELAAAPADTRDEKLLGLWTRKEAYLKGIGLGVVHDPAQVAFESSAGGWSAVRDGGERTHWHVAALELETGWVGALAVEGAPLEARRRTWSPRLLLDGDH